MHTLNLTDAPGRAQPLWRRRAGSATGFDRGQLTRQLVGVGVDLL